MSRLSHDYGVAASVNSVYNIAPMIGVTLGIGDGWRQCAERCSDRMSEMTGIECLTISELPQPVYHPSWGKCQILDLFPNENWFMYFDADIFPLKPFDPVQIASNAECSFIAVPDKENGSVEAESKEHGIPIGKYFNAGFMIFHRISQPVWDYAWTKHPHLGSWIDQTAVNQGVVKTGMRIKLLDRKYNTLVYDDPNIFNPESLAQREEVNLHIAGRGDGCRRIEQMQKSSGLFRM